MSYTHQRLPDHLRAAWEAFEKTLQPAIDLEGNSGQRKEAYARIRAELKAAQKHGIIPAFCKFSVRADHNSLHVDLVQWEGRVFSDEYTEYLMAKYRKESGAPLPVESRYREEDFANGRSRGHELPRLVIALQDVGHITAYIANRHNFDHSDIMTDYFHVGYYLHVETRDIEWTAEQAIRLECDAAFAALHAKAAAAAATLHESCRDKIIESTCGRRGFECAGEWALKDLIKIAERGAGRPMGYCKRQRGWRVVKEISGTTVTEDGEEIPKRWTKEDARAFAARIPGGDHV